jgi:hypothetical protein
MNQEIMIFYSEKSRVNSILDFLILWQPLVSERHCGSGGDPSRLSRKGNAPPLERGRGKVSPPANPERVTA